MPATKPFVMVGRSASSRSSVSAASVALEHTKVAPASRAASIENAIPPIQKKGELQNSLSSAVSPRISLSTIWCSSSDAWVCTTPFGVLVEPDVYTIARGSEGSTSSSIASSRAASTVVAGSDSMSMWRSDGTADSSMSASRLR